MSFITLQRFELKNKDMTEVLEKNLSDDHLLQSIYLLTENEI